VKNSICNKDVPQCAKFVPTTVAYGEPCFVHYWRVATGSFWRFQCGLAPVEYRDDAHLLASGPADGPE
jgi:hypothetical protein